MQSPPVEVLEADPAGLCFGGRVAEVESNVDIVWLLHRGDEAAIDEKGLTEKRPNLGCDALR